MEKTQLISPRVGPTPNDRRILEAVTAAGTEPSGSTDGYFLNRVRYAHLFFKLENPDVSVSCTFYVQVWWWNTITEMWHVGERLKVNNNDIHTLEIQGLNRIYLQVDQIVFTGSGSPSLSAWIASVVPT